MTQRSDPRQAGWDEPDVRPARTRRSRRRPMTMNPIAQGAAGSRPASSSWLALIGSVAFTLYAVTVRDSSQIPLLAAGAVVLGIVFAVLALFTIRATWRAGDRCP